MSINYKASLFGAFLGLSLAYVLFNNVSWYHDLLVWSWTNPWMLALAVPAYFAGVAVAHFKN